MTPITTKTAKVATLIPHPLSDEIFGQMAEDRFEDFVEDVRSRGIQYPLEVDASGRVICGSQRLRALKVIGIQETEIIIRDNLVTEEDVEEHLLKDNIYRRQLTYGQMFNAGVRLEDIYRKQSAARQGGRGRSRDEKAEGDPMVTADRVARDVGISSSRQYARLKKVYTSGDTKTMEDLDAHRISLSAAADRIGARKTETRTVDCDDPRARLLQFTRWKKRVETLSAFLSRSIPAGYEHEGSALLSDLKTKLTGIIRRD